MKADKTDLIKILVIDDEASIRHSFADYLKDRGFETFLAENGRLGLETLEQVKPQLVLVDLRMPVMDGLEFMRQSKAAAPGLPIIVISGANRIEDVVKAQQLGSWDYLTKPLKDLSMLSYAVDKALEKAHLLKENRIYQENLEILVRERTDDLEKANAHLLASEERYRTLFERSSDAIFLVDVQTGQYINANQAAEKLTGYSLAEIKTKTIKMLTPKGATGRLDQIRTLETTKNFGEVTFLRADGTERIAVLNAFPLQHGKLVVDIAYDITERVRAEKEIQQYIKRLTALRSIDQAITGSFDLNISLSILLEHLLAQLEVDAASVLCYQKDSQTLTFSQGKGFHTAALRHTDLELGEGHAGNAALQRRHIFIPDLRQPETGFLESPEFKEEGVVAYYALPLVAKDSLVGVLEIFHRSRLDPNADWVDYLKTLAGQAAIAIDNATLFSDLQHSNRELGLAYDATIEGWAQALEMRDAETEGHSRRVVELTIDLARRAGIDENDMTNIYRGALLHDIGKMGVPDSILQKAGPLTSEEWKVIYMHPVYAYEWLSSIEYLKPALDIPYCHHEKWDGTGYPRGLKGEEIPIAARIFSIVDYWEALISKRTYKEAWPQEKVLESIKKQSGKNFDPQIVNIFLKKFEEEDAGDQNQST
ncbi:MAG: response regulator [Anaerolineae bacterium]|jgi:PAS domain S-box-containing protein|nr:response regulator [Anaerolineae bacterium]MBT4459944.1 response regulator [Anaerolineae bacterium]MBT4842422.1 response regulator [Anaerolineae bacterium]MBT6060594.1 response regulator [Anaerolineae bacterium]MBT6324170.1 response regulator [Anaerolineae bacterium]